MEPSFNFTTPVISALPCRKPLEDSGYLSTTPDSENLSQRRGAWPLARKCSDLSELFTPEGANTAAAKRSSLRRHKSGEDSQIIHYVQHEPITKLDYTYEESIIIDEDLHDIDNGFMRGEHEENQVHVEPGNRSFYEEMDMSCNGYEASFDDTTKFVQESFALQVCNVDFGTVKLEPNLPAPVSASESLRTALKKRRISKQVPVVYTAWNQELSRQSGTLSISSGQDTVDFLYHLGVASDHSDTVSLILSYLSPHELSSAARVSTNWLAVVTADERSRRRLAEPAVPSPEKENAKKVLRATGVARAGALHSVENLHPQQPGAALPAAAIGQMELFWTFSRKMEEGYRHDRCVKCNGRAVVQMASEIGCCPSPCKYVYCARCKCKDHRPAPCVCVGAWDPLLERKARISTKKSKRRLLRLLC